MDSTRQALQRFFALLPPHALAVCGLACVVSGFLCMALDAPRIYPNVFIALAVSCSLLWKIQDAINAHN
jgi:hypothetical protein